MYRIEIWGNIYKSNIILLCYCKKKLLELLTKKS